MSRLGFLEPEQDHGLEVRVVVGERAESSSVAKLLGIQRILEPPRRPDGLLELFSCADISGWPSTMCSHRSSVRYTRLPSRSSMSQRLPTPWPVTGRGVSEQ